MPNYSHDFTATVASYVGSRVYLSGETKAICVSYILQCNKVNLKYPFLPV
jgi:hypothetical protein